MTLDTFLTIATGGIVLGGLYALMAAGLAVVWTTLGIFNFAHGAFIAAGAYIAWQVGSTDASGLGFIAGAGAAVIMMFLLGMLAQMALVRPSWTRSSSSVNRPRMPM